MARRSQHADDAPRVAAGRSAAGGSSPSPRARPAQRDFFATAADPAAPAHAATTEEAATPFDAPPPSRLRRIELLQSLERDEVASCTRCQLHATRTQTVFGEGSPEARLMFIGEGPGENEDLQGRPFVGRAGQLLDRMISAMGLARPEVYIANVVKCRPPGNRVPTPVEVATCTGFLHRQIEWIRPQVIVTLGLPAARHLLRTNRTMGQMRGQWHEWRGIRVMPTYHPAFLLRSYTEQNRRLVWEDLRAVMRELGQGGPDGGEG